MKIAIIGAGFIGTITGFCLADIGHDVVFFDKSEEKLNSIKNGDPLFYEPGLKEMMHRTMKEGKVMFAKSASEAIQNSDVVFICVATKLNPDNSLDFTHLIDVSADIGKNLNKPKVVVSKLILPPGASEIIINTIKENNKDNVEFYMVSNPGFLTGGKAIENFKNPDRIVIGTDGSQQAKEVMENIYKGIADQNHQIFWTDLKTANMIEYSVNTILAMKVSMINQLSEYCEKIGVDITEVSKGISMDSRIGPGYLSAGVGYGGFSFPKIVRSLSKIMKDSKCHTELIDSIEIVNNRQKLNVIPKVMRLLGIISGKTIAVLGLSFKPNTSNIKESPAIQIIQELQRLGAYVKVYDPEAMSEAKKVLKGVIYAENTMKCVENSDLMLIATGWDVFKNLDFNKVKEVMRKPNIVDGWNLYNPKELKELGFNYYGVGRK